MGKHRKLMPTAVERLIWGLGDGSTCPSIDTPLGRMGAVICWENYTADSSGCSCTPGGCSSNCTPTVDGRDRGYDDDAATSHWRAAALSFRLANLPGGGITLRIIRSMRAWKQTCFSCAAAAAMRLDD